MITYDYLSKIKNMKFLCFPFYVLQNGLNPLLDLQFTQARRGCMGGARASFDHLVEGLEAY